MKVTYERNIGHSYMVLHGENVNIDYQIQMCCRNKFLHCLEMNVIVADGDMEYWYEITGLQSLSQYLEKNRVDETVLLRLVDELWLSYQEIEQYLLEEDGLQLKPDYIYIRHADGRIFYCFFPEKEKRLFQGFRELMEYLLPFVDHERELAVSMAYHIYQRTQEENYSLEDIVLSLEKYRGRTGEAPREEKKVSPARVEQDKSEDEKKESLSRREELYEKVEFVKSRGMRWLEEKWQGITRKKREQEVFLPMTEEDKEKYYEEPTVYLPMERREEKKMKLIPIDGNRGEIVELTKEVYCIGSKEDMDIVINENTVSRLHARIDCSEGIYYLEDMNSRNGTRINGKLLQYMEKVAIQPQDEISFAEVRYLCQEQ